MDQSTQAEVCIYSNNIMKLYYIWELLQLVSSWITYLTFIVDHFSGSWGGWTIQETAAYFKIGSAKKYAQQECR